MKKLALLALIAGLATACGSPPPSNVAPAATAKPVGPSAQPAAATAEPETFDAPFRYVPPELATARGALPTPVDFTLASGIPVRLVEMRGSPVVAAIVIVKWKTIAKIPGTAAVFGSGFFRLKMPSGRSISEELELLGARTFATSEQDAMYLRVSALKDSAEQAFSLVFAALRSGKLDAAGLDRARDFTGRDLENESPSNRVDRVSDTMLFPASHRYHEPFTGSLDSLKKIKLDDVHKYRDAALVPEGVSFGVAGAMSRSELSSVLDRAIGSWTAKPPPKAPDAPKKGAEVIPPGMAHGVFVSEEASGPSPQVVVAIPMPDAGKPGFAGALVSWGLLVERAAGRLRAASTDGRSHLDSHMRPRIQGRTLLLYADVLDHRPAATIEHLLLAMEDVTKGVFPDQDVTYVRRMRAHRATPGDGIESLLWFLADEITTGAPPGSELSAEAAIDAIPRDEIVRAAGMYFKKERVSVVVDGGAKSDKEALEKLGAGPVSFVSAPKKGAKK